MRKCVQMRELKSSRTGDVNLFLHFIEEATMENMRLTRSLVKSIFMDILNF